MPLLVDEVTKTLSKDRDEPFDIIIAADCMYMPWLPTQGAPYFYGYAPL